MEHKFEVKAFGMIAEKIGTDTIQVIGIETIEELKIYLNEQFPNLKDMKFSIALDKQIIQDAGEIPSGSEVALLPPFSGG
jgi:molybdopterin converting factor small subunit